MATAVLKVRLSIDGRPLITPIVQTIEIAGPIQQSVFNLEAAQAYDALDANGIPDVATQAIYFLMPLTRGPVTARFGGQTSGGVEVNRRGLLLAFRANLAAKPQLQNEDADNASGVLVAGAQAAA